MIGEVLKAQGLSTVKVLTAQIYVWTMGADMLLDFWLKEVEERKIRGSEDEDESEDKFLTCKLPVKKTSSFFSIPK